MGISGSSLLILAAKEVPKMKKNRKKKEQLDQGQKRKIRNPSLDQRKCPFLEKKYFSHACSESSNISKVKIVLKSNLNFHPSIFQ